MRQSFARFRHAVGLPSALVAMALLLVNSATEIIVNDLPNWWSQVAWLLFLSAITLFLFFRWEKAWKTGNTQVGQMGRSGNTKLHRRRGIVVVLGLDSAEPDSPVAKLLQKTDCLEWIAFVGTPETVEKKVVQGVCSKLLPAAGRSIPHGHIRAWEYGNAESLADFEQATTEALEWMMRNGVTAPEIVVDITGCRRPMGYGSMTAADAHRVETQYLASAWDHTLNQPVPGKETFKVVQEFHPE